MISITTDESHINIKIDGSMSALVKDVRNISNGLVQTLLECAQDNREAQFAVMCCIHQTFSDALSSGFMMIVDPDGDLSKQNKKDADADEDAPASSISSIKIDLKTLRELLQHNEEDKDEEDN